MAGVTMISNFDTVLLNLASHMQQAMPRVNQILERNAPKYQESAKEIVRGIVYSHPPNSRYPRSMDTLNSVDVQKVPDGLVIFNNPALGTNNQRFPGLQSYATLSGTLYDETYRYYPAFVLRGNFFGNQQAQRNYVGVWAIQLKEEILQDLEQEGIFTKYHGI